VLSPVDPGRHASVVALSFARPSTWVIRYTKGAGLFQPRALAEFVVAMLGVAAKLERRRIAERTARGRADAKAKGVKFGRKPTLTPHQQQEARERLAAGETQRSVACSYNVSQSTVSRLVA
jgi:DNA invertase Pin-like site-specific DNA recombinase